MSEKEYESLSSLMDGEADEMSVHRLLGKVEKDPALKSKWRRYHLAQDILKGQTSAHSELDVSALVSSAIAGEATPKSERPWMKAIGGMSIAASVAFVVVIGSQLAMPGAQDSMNSVASKSSEEIVKPTDVVRGETMVAQQLDNLSEEELRQAQDRLNDYLKRHAQDSALGQGQTAMPFARVVNFENNKKGRE